MLSRENLKHVVVLVCALVVGWAGPSIAHGVHAQFAHNADKVDGKHAVGAGASLNKAKGKLVAHGSQGKLPARFVPNSFVTEGEHSGRTKRVVTIHSGSSWVPNDSGAGAPTTFSNEGSSTRASSDGRVALPLQAPRFVDGSTYGLAEVVLCYDTSAGGYISHINVLGNEVTTDPNLLFDPTDRTSAANTCEPITVGKRTLYGATLSAHLDGSGWVTLRGVRAVWTRAASKVAP